MATLWWETTLNRCGRSFTQEHFASQYFGKQQRWKEPGLDWHHGSRRPFPYRGLINYKANSISYYLRTNIVLKKSLCIQKELHNILKDGIKVFGINSPDKRVFAYQLQKYENSTIVRSERFWIWFHSAPHCLQPECKATSICLLFFGRSETLSQLGLHCTLAFQVPLLSQRPSGYPRSTTELGYRRGNGLLGPCACTFHAAKQFLAPFFPESMQNSLLLQTWFWQPIFSTTIYKYRFIYVIHVKFYFLYTPEDTKLLMRAFEGEGILKC